MRIADFALGWPRRVCHPPGLEATLLRDASGEPAVQQGQYNYIQSTICFVTRVVTFVNVGLYDLLLL